MDHVEAVQACLHGVRLRFRISGSCLKRAFPWGMPLEVALQSLAQLLYSAHLIGDKITIGALHWPYDSINTIVILLCSHTGIFMHVRPADARHCPSRQMLVAYWDTSVYLRRTDSDQRAGQRNIT